MKSNDKEKTLKAIREKSHVKYPGRIIQMVVEFLGKTIETKRDWINIFKVLKEKLSTENAIPL